MALTSQRFRLNTHQYHLASRTSSDYHWQLKPSIEQKRLGFMHRLPVPQPTYMHALPQSNVTIILPFALWLNPLSYAYHNRSVFVKIGGQRHTRAKGIASNVPWLHPGISTRCQPMTSPAQPRPCHKLFACPFLTVWLNKKDTFEVSLLRKRAGSGSAEQAIFQKSSRTERRSLVPSCFLR